MKIRRTVLLVVSAIFLLGGCTAKKDEAKTTPAKVLAKVNGIEITEDDLRLSARTAHGMAPEGEKLRALDDVIKAELLYQEALRLGLDKSPSYKREVERLEKQLANAKRAELTRRLYNTQIAAKLEISDKEARDFYDRNRERINTEVHLGVLTFLSQEEAQAARQKIAGGEDFRKVATAIAGKTMGTGQTPAGQPPWDMGFLPWGRIPPEIVDVVYNLKPGQVSEVVSSKPGLFRLYTLFETRQTKQKTDFEAVAGLIKMRLLDKKIKESYEQYIAKLWRDAKIEKF